MRAEQRPEPSAAQDRIIRVPVGQTIPEGYRFKQLLGQETGLAFGSAANFTADVVLVEEVESDARYSSPGRLRLYLRVDRLCAEIAGYLVYRAKATSCFFSGSRLGHEWKGLDRLYDECDRCPKTFDGYDLL